MTSFAPLRNPLRRHSSPLPQVNSLLLDLLAYLPYLTYLPSPLLSMIPIHFHRAQQTVPILIPLAAAIVAKATAASYRDKDKDRGSFETPARKWCGVLSYWLLFYEEGRGERNVDLCYIYEN